MKKLLSILILILTLSACTSEETTTIKVAQQYGIAYAPLKIMEVNNYLEEETNMEVDWVKANNTAAIREGILADEIDIGFMAIPPFLIGVENGMDWKLISGLSYVELGLVSKADYESVKDISETDRIALPQPGSVQHILLSMAAESELNDPAVFDNQIVSMNHPSGYEALLADTEITLHFTSEPYLSKELEENNLLISGSEAFGEEFTFIVGAATADIYDNQEAYKGFKRALLRSIEFIEENPEEAAAILAQDYDLSETEIYDLLTSENTVYSEEIKGLEKFNSFMVENDYLNQMYEDVYWDE